MKTFLKVFLLVASLSFTFYGCKKKETETLCNNGAHSGFTTLETDACGDGATAERLDGTRMEYKYDAASDSLWFLFTVNTLTASQGIGVNVMVNIPGAGNTFNFWGNNNTAAYNRLLTVWVTGAAPSSYLGLKGIADATGVAAGVYNNLLQNNISIKVNTTDKTIMLGLKRVDLLPDTFFTGTTITVKIAGAVGANDGWNDDIYGANTSLTLVKSAPTFVLPVLTTTVATGITSSSATSGGNVTSDGGSTITQRGVVYSLNNNPTTADSTILAGGSTGIFACILTGLLPNTPYYVRAFATNSAGTAYGNITSFTTIIPLSIPTVRNENSFIPVTATSGNGLQGTVTNDGNATVTERGFVYSSVSNFPVYGVDMNKASGNGLGYFSVDITGLNPATTYYARPYAVNSVGVGYGGVSSFTTLNLNAKLSDIRALDPGVGNLIYLPQNTVVSVTVTSDYTTSMFPSANNLNAEDSSAGMFFHFTAPHTFALGTKLDINVSGLELSNYNGVLEVNNVPLANATVTGSGNFVPQTAHITQLLTNYTAWESRLFRITGVVISGGLAYTYGYSSNFLDDGTGTIRLYTDPGASFSSYNCPTGTHVVTGILREYNGTMEIMIRNLSDVQ